MDGAPTTPTVVRLIAQDDTALGEDGESLLRVEPEGLKLLESLGSERVAVCSVAGIYRTGKSFFLNRLASSTQGFDVGETTEPCTRGVWLWHRPDLKTADGATLLLMDTEGLASADQDETYDAKVFALALLLSSYFVLNVVGVIDDSTIERLHLVTEVTKRIVVEGGSADEDAFPPLLVLVRDFALTPTRDGVAISDQEYLEEALRDRGAGQNAKRHQRRDATRQALRGLFPRGRRACATLVRPAHDEAALRRAHALKDEELREEFVDKLKLLRSALVDGRDEIGVPSICAKRVLGAPCSASALAALARHHVDAINNGAAPSIHGAWAAASRELNARASRDALDAFAATLAIPADADDATRGLPAPPALADALSAETACRAAADAALSTFDAKSCDGADRAEARTELVQQLAQLGDDAARNLAARSDACCDAALRGLEDAADAFETLPAPTEDEAHEALVVERARAGLWEPLCAGVSNAFRGPRRDVRLHEALAASAVPRCVAPAVAAACHRGDARSSLLRQRLEAERSDERAAAKARLDEAEARAAEERSRLTTEIDGLATKLATTESDRDDVRSAKRDVDDQLADAQRRAKDLDADVARTQASLENTQKRLAATADDLANAESRAGDAEASLEATRRELHSERELGATLSQSLEALHGRVAELDGRLKRSEDDAAAAVARHDDAITQREEELAALRENLTASEADAAKLSDDLDDERRTHETLQADADARNLQVLMEGACASTRERDRLEQDAAVACAVTSTCSALVARVEASQRLERREAYFSAKLLQTERKAAKAASSSSPGLFSPAQTAKAARRLFSMGSEKIDSVASSFLNLVDEELEEAAPVPALAASTPLRAAAAPRDRSVPKSLRERAQEQARRGSAS